MYFPSVPAWHLLFFMFTWLPIFSFFLYSLLHSSLFAPQFTSFLSLFPSFLFFFLSFINSIRFLIIMKPVQTLDRKFDNVKRKIYISFLVCNAITSNFCLARRKFTLIYYHCADSNILGKILVRLFLKYDLSVWNNLHNSFTLSNIGYFYNTYIQYVFGINR